jgi:hypothetical protein
MKSGILAGAIAGIVAGIVNFALGPMLAQIEIIEILGGTWEIWDPSFYVTFALAFISLALIWGTIFGLIYSRYYDSTPGRGVLKGLFFGLMIWFIKDVAAGSYVALIFVAINISTTLILVGFFMWVVYGLVLGYLYKPPK